MHRVLVTGASGFIGSHVLNLLSNTGGYSAAGLVRETSDLFRIEEGCKLVRGSLEDDLEPLLRGYDSVVHTAGLATDWGHHEDFIRTNVEGTERVLRGSISAGVKRFLHISSTVVYGFGKGSGVEESAGFDPFPQSYCISKSEAEKRIAPFKEDVSLFILRPSNVFGPLDLRFTYQLLQALERNTFAFPSGGRTVTSPCYVLNLADAVKRCLESRLGGGTYNISDGADLPWRDFLSLAAGSMGRGCRILPVPSGPLFGVSKIVEKIYTLAGSKRAPLITPYRIAQARGDYGFSTEAAARDLGYDPPYTTAEGMRASVTWYRAIRERINKGKHDIL